MTISLTPELDRVLSEKLASGRYGSVEELLTAAFRALGGEEEEAIAAIAEGNADFEAGRYSIEFATRVYWNYQDDAFFGAHAGPVPQSTGG